VDTILAAASASFKMTSPDAYSVRVLQRVALAGRSCGVACTMLDSISVFTLAGRPERGASLRRSSMSPWRAPRNCYFQQP